MSYETTISLDLKVPFTTDEQAAKIQKILRDSAFIHDFCYPDDLDPDDILYVNKRTREVRVEHCSEDFEGDIFDDLRTLYQDLKENADATLGGSVIDDEGDDTYLYDFSSNGRLECFFIDYFLRYSVKEMKKLKTAAKNMFGH